MIREYGCSLAMLSGLLVTAGCNSEAKEYRAYYDQSYPSVAPHILALQTIAKTPFASPACTTSPTGPSLVFAGDDLADRLRGTSHYQSKPSYPSSDPCRGVDLNEDALALLSHPFDVEKSGVREEGKHSNRYKTAILQVSGCFSVARSVAIVKQVEWVAPKLEGERSFSAGYIVSDVFIYSAKGAPICVERFRTVSDSTATVREDIVLPLLEGNLHRKHDARIVEFLGLSEH